MRRVRELRVGGWVTRRKGGGVRGEVYEQNREASEFDGCLW